jgi:pyrroline-5-carboxylate reductase
MVSLKNNKFLILGAGNMGISFIKALLQNKISASKIFILEKRISPELKKIRLKKKIKILKAVSKLPKNFRPDVVLLAVKPNQLDSAVDEELVNIVSDSLIISIIAGKKIRELKKITRNKNNTVRAMTNTPVSLGMGTSILYFDKGIKKKYKNLAREFLALVGQVNEAKNESVIDSFTAIYGSGPAYIYLMIESLIKISSKAGLKNSENMVIQTFLGSLLLLMSGNSDAKTLRENVTSKGGTTQAALSILNSRNGLPKLLSRAIMKARKRSIELSSN